jgi:hypothetical protein
MAESLVHEHADELSILSNFWKSRQIELNAKFIH